MKIQEGHLEVTPEISLYYREYGPRSDATPVIGLHGYWRTSRDFEELAEHLAAGRRVVTVDLRGRGRSGRSADAADYHFDRIVEDVVKLLDHVSISRAVFVGTALGAQIGMELAANRPDRVAGLVLNDSAPESNPAAGARMAKFAGTDELTYQEALSRVKGQYQEDFPHLSEADYERIVYRNYAKSATGGYVRDFDPLTNLDIVRQKTERPTFWAEFNAIGDAPIAILRGESSDYLTVDMAERMLAANPNARLHTIPNVGHPVMMWEPEAFAAIEELLHEVDQAR